MTPKLKESFNRTFMELKFINKGDDNKHFEF